MWENIGTVILLNAGLLIIFAGMLFILVATADQFLLFIIVAFIGFWILSWYLKGAALIAVSFSSDSKKCLRDVGSCIAKGFSGSAAAGFFFSLCLMIFLSAVPFYLSLKTIVSYIPVVLLFCGAVIAFPAVQMLIPLAAVQPGSFKQTFINSFLILFTEPLLVIVVTVNSICIIALSVLTAFLLPGIGMVLLLWEETCLLIIKIYAGELNEEAVSNFIIGEEKRLRKNPIKSFLMPWKK
jgi:hypothetical protein